MRVLIPVSAHPNLHRVGEWLMIEKFILANQDRGWYYVLIPEGSIVTCGSLPRTTFLRANTDNSYYFFRELGDFFNINDGKYVVDVATPLAPQMAVGVDMHCNAHGFNDLVFNLPIMILQTMFYNYKDVKLRRMCTFYNNLFFSRNDYDVYCNWVRKEFRPSVAEKIIKNADILTLGCMIEPLHEKSKCLDKFDKVTILYGSRMNDLHNPEEALDIIVSLYRIGLEFDVYITTPDFKFPESIVEKGKSINAKMISKCTQDQYHTLMVKCHLGLTTGKAAAPTFGVEFLSAGTVCVAECTQWLDLLEELNPKYPYVYKKRNEAIAYMKMILENLDAVYDDFRKANYWDQVKHLDTYSLYRKRYSVFESIVKPLQSRKKNGMKGNRIKIFLSLLAGTGGQATLSEMVDMIERNNGIVRDKQTGRWITRKLIHDSLMSNPSVIDLEDDSEPRYQLDYDLYREWLNSCSIE